MAPWLRREAAAEGGHESCIAVACKVWSSLAKANTCSSHQCVGHQINCGHECMIQPQAGNRGMGYKAVPALTCRNSLAEAERLM
eukprot:476856-Pelagomonas_calceolata.AAC.1